MSNDDLEIITKNLLLRPMRASDIHSVFEGLSHPDVIRYYAVSFMTPEETKKQMDWYQTIKDEQSGLWWAICDQDDHQFYGAVGFNDIHPVHRRAEIGFWLLPEYWGRGIVPEAAEAACHYGFERMNLHRIYAYVETANTNSSSVLRKLHFVSEGTLKECELKNGQWIDLDVYALVKPNPTA